MDFGLTLLQLSFSPRLVFLVLALPVVFLMIAALVAMVSLGGRRAWRLLAVIVFVPVALLLGTVAFLAASRIKSLESHVEQRPEAVAGRPDLEISREIADLERRAAELRRLRERLQALEESGQHDAVSTPSVAPAGMVQEALDTAGDHETLTAEAADVDAQVASLRVAVEADADDNRPKTETSEAPDAGLTPTQIEMPSSGDPSTGGEIDPPQRPVWVEQPPQREGAVHMTPITIGPYSTRQECLELADFEIKQAVAQYGDWYLSRYDGSHGKLVRTPGYDLDLDDPDHCYHELRESRLLDEKMHSLHVRLDFPPSYRQQLDSCWKETLVARRLTRIVVLSGAVLALLTALYLYLRLDLATQGFYTRRLQCGVAVAILTLVASGVLLARWIPWL